MASYVCAIRTNYFRVTEEEFHGEQSSLAIIKKMAGRCYDYAYSLDYIQDERNQEFLMESEENPVTPCGCIHCSCEECGVAAMCANI